MLNSDIKSFFIYSGLLILVMLIAELTYRIFKLKTEWTRKIAHVGSGIVALTYPHYFTSHWGVFALTLSFTLILFFSKKFGFFQSIFSVGRKSYGELFFVWSSWILFLLYKNTGELIYFSLPFSIVVFADPMAAIVGTYFPFKKYRVFGNEKSYMGSLAFFITAYVLTFLLMSYFGFSFITDTYSFYGISFFHALILTLVEAISVKGTDNFTIPLVSVIYLFLLHLIL